MGNVFQLSRVYENLNDRITIIRVKRAASRIPALIVRI